MNFLTYKIRLYPTAQQESRLNRLLKLGCGIYNRALEERIADFKAFKERHPTPVRQDYTELLTGNAQQKALTAEKANNPNLKLFHSQSLQSIIQRLDEAYQGFFRRVKVGQKPGFPRFKPLHRFRSVEYKATGYKFIDGSRIQISKVGAVKYRDKRIPAGKMKWMTIKLSSTGKWYATIVAEAPVVIPAICPREAVGLDRGITKLVALSNGEFAENPRFLKKAEVKLRREQRRLSRKQKGSANRAKSRDKVAAIHERVSDQRLDYLHKTANSIVKRFDLVAIEDLKIKNMVRNHCLAKAIYDASWGILGQLLSYKAERAGGAMVRVDPRNTSRECPRCGMVHPDNRKGESFSCIQCAYKNHADTVGAMNILNRAGHARITPAETAASTTRLGGLASGVAEAGTFVP